MVCNSCVLGEHIYTFGGAKEAPIERINAQELVNGSPFAKWEIVKISLGQEIFPNSSKMFVSNFGYSEILILGGFESKEVKSKTTEFDVGGCYIYNTEKNSLRLVLKNTMKFTIASN